MLSLIILLTAFFSPPDSPLKPCELPGIDEKLLCGKLSVHENRQTKKGRKIDLNVVVLPALDQSKKEAPLFDLAGGPGVASSTSAGFYASDGRALRRNRDVVLVDQRGTGGSNLLQCDKSLKKPLDEMYPVNYVTACRRELEQIADLTQYTTSIAMDDLDDVRAWLGYEQINLLGLSYGSRAALVYLRQHPTRVRSMILMGVAPTNSRLPMYHTRNAQRAMELLFAECAADSSCHAAYPRLRQDFEGLLAKLEQQPLRITRSARNGASNHETEIEIRRDLFAEEIRGQLYNARRARRVPYIVHQAAAGNFKPFLDIVNPASRVGSLIADGMYLSVTCAEDVPFIDQAEAARMNKGTLFGNYRVQQQTRACRHWARGTVPSGFEKGVKATAPVLLVSGGMDPVTGPDWAEEVASHLPNSKHWLIERQGHGPTGMSNLNCLQDVVTRFLESPDPTKLDTSCGKLMQPPPFYVER